MSALVKFTSSKIQYKSLLFWDNQALTSQWFMDDQALTSQWFMDNQVLTSQWFVDNHALTSHWFMDNQVLTSQWFMDNQALTSQWFMDNQALTSQWFMDNQALTSQWFMDCFLPFIKCKLLHPTLYIDKATDWTVRKYSIGKLHNRHHYHYTSRLKSMNKTKIIWYNNNTLWSWKLLFYEVHALENKLV